MKTELTLENCEVLTFPESVYFYAESGGNKIKSLLLKLEIPEIVKGNWWSYNKSAAKGRLECPDITCVETDCYPYQVPWKGESETNLAEGIAFDGDFAYIVFGEKKALEEIIKDLSETDQAHFSEAIENIGKSRPTKPIVRNPIISPEEAIAYILAEHFSRVDKPKGGWQVEGENPYKKILSRMES